MELEKFKRLINVKDPTSYTEARDPGLTIDWNKALDLLEKIFLAEPEHGRSEELVEILRFLDVMAMNWVTCACGSQCSVIPRDAEGMPIDRELKGHGGSFGGYFNPLARASSVTRARARLALIEKRSAELINEINSKQK